ncbi:MAG: carboxyl transferase domain-containing protein, partial [Candidatus Kapaibacterium sp.]
VANSVVPKFTFIVGNSYGAGNYAMCGKAYDPRLIYAFPTANIAVMGGAQASKTLLTIRLSALEREGKVLGEDEQRKLLHDIQQRYDATTTPLYAASRLWVDGIVSPADTRSIVSRGLAMASHNTDVPEWKSGVFQV